VIETALNIAFWGSLALLTYIFLLYPVAVYLLARWMPRVHGLGDELPYVSLCIPIYNEEAILDEKITNALALDYPADKLEIVFASDGSTDRSVEILRHCQNPRIRIFAFSVNRGKAAVLNEVVPQLRGEVVLLSDASGILDPSALRKVVRHFHDSRIGAVFGIYHIFKEGRTRMDSAESTYHGFEMQLRLWEGRFRTTLSGTGALCAFRKTEFEALPVGIINEDYVLPARIALKGKRVIYEPQAHVWDRISTSLPHVFRRRVRIAYGNWQQLTYLRTLLDPRQGYLFWIFVSHKVLRMFLPLVLLVTLLSSTVLGPTVFNLLISGTAALLILSVLGLLLDDWFQERNPLGFVALIFLNVLAVMVGSYRYLTQDAVRW